VSIGRAVWRAAAVLLLALLPSNVVATALPLLRVEWGASATALGWVFAAYQVGYVGAVLLLLPLTDRVPARRVIVGSALATAAASLLFPLVAVDVWSAAALRALAGAGLAGVYLPGVRVVAAAVAGRRRGAAVGLYVAAFYLGTALSLGATGLLLGAGDWRRAALALGAASALAVPLGFGLGGAAPPGLERSAERRLEAGAGGPIARARRAAGRRLDVLADGPTRRTILAYAGHSWELYVSRAWLAAFLAGLLAAGGTATAEATAEGGKWAALIAGAGTVGVWLGGWLSDRWGRFPAALAIAAASGALSLGFGFLGSSFALLLAVGCVYSVLIAADSSIYSTLVTELAPPARLGSAQAAQAFIGFGASSVAPVAAGFVLDRGGDFAGVFVLAGLASLAGALALVPLARRERGALRSRQGAPVR
jgi:MFS family permease